MKLELDWHFVRDEMPVIPEGKRNIEVFAVSENGSYMSVPYSKYGFNTSDWTGTPYAMSDEKSRETAIPTRAWAYIPDDWDDKFFPEDEEVTEDETV